MGPPWGAFCPITLTSCFNFNELLCGTLLVFTAVCENGARDRRRRKAWSARNCASAWCRVYTMVPVRRTGLTNSRTREYACSYSLWSKQENKLAQTNRAQQAASGLQTIAARPRASSHLHSNRGWHGRMITWVFFQAGISRIRIGVGSTCDLWYKSWSQQPHDPRFFSFDSLPACDRQTDGHAADS